MHLRDYGGVLSRRGIDNYKRPSLLRSAECCTTARYIHMNAIKRFLRKRTGCIKFAMVRGASPRSQHPPLQSNPFVSGKTRRQAAFRVRVIARNNAAGEMALNDFG